MNEENSIEVLSSNDDPILLLIEKYKQHIAQTQLQDELYKWELIEEYKGRPNLDTGNLLEELKSLDYNNLIYHLGKAVIIELVKAYPEEMLNIYGELFDEAIHLTIRVKDFSDKTKTLYERMGKTKSHHQDERSISTYLTFRNPEKYTFYKYTFYKNYCKLLGIKKAKKDEQYTHYLSLVDELIKRYIVHDKELIEQVKSYIPKYYDGSNHKLLAQDILYQMLDNNTEVNHWVFQGNPKQFNFKDAFKHEVIKTWTVTAHKEKIKKGDKVIIWLTGKDAGCYALTEVKSNPYERSSASDDEYWLVENKSNMVVDIDITHNLVDNPLLKVDIDSRKELTNLKVGYQGSNFAATEKEYNVILELMKDKIKGKHYWLYAPGENARNWEEFYKEGIMAIGWDEIGDLTQYKNTDQIKKDLYNAYGGNENKNNDSKANFEFCNVLKVGDVVIVKKGRGELLGYGLVISDYIYDNTRENNFHIRKVDWKLKGSWSTNDPLVLKTLTDITPYATEDPNYKTYYERLLGIMTGRVIDNITTSKKINYPLNTIFYGPPGTGKTYNTILRAAEIIEDREIEDYKDALEIFNANLHDQIDFITFHQNYSYEDFIQGLRPDTDNNEELTFHKKDGIFKKIADRALKNLKESEKPSIPKKSFKDAFSQFIYPLVEGEVEEIKVKMKKVSYYITAVSDKSIDFRKASGGTAHTLSISTLERMYEAESDLEIRGLTPYYAPLLNELLKIGKDTSGRIEEVEKKNYVIIIDEINRANISRVFGELITLIEADKRSNGEIRLEVLLPSGDKFTVPSNLYIIGTMNTADKSIALLDIALRRRFEFEAMYPSYEIDNIHDVEILKKLNKKIIETKGYDFQIGHSFFLNSNGDAYDLVKIMNNKVIPLLLEYYMNDDKEVRTILKAAGLLIDEKSWPLRIIGKDDKSV